MPKRNIIIGAGGHGKVIADMMQRQGRQVIGFLDDNRALSGQYVFDLPILGTTEQWQQFNPDGIVVGIGDNRIRHLIVQRIEKMKTVPPWISLIHPNAVVAESVTVGAGTVVMAGAIINADTSLGRHVIINTGATVDHDCQIGNFVHIAPGANLAGDVKVLTGAFLGIGCAVVPGCQINQNVVIGAGACVTKSITEPGVTVVGVPARPLKRS